MQIHHEDNFICLSGCVRDTPTYSHTLYGEAFYEFWLVVPRLSGAEDILPITAGARLMPIMPKQGDTLEITGQLRSYNKQIDGTNRLILTVFAKHMELKPPDAVYRNEVSLTGYICKPPVYRTTPFSREIADVLIAVNRSYHKSDYLPIIAWGRNARFVSNLSVGDCLQVTGRLQSREYQKILPTGEVLKRTAYEVSTSGIGQIE